MSSDKITLMMATYNRLDLTKNMLQNLLKSTKCNFNMVIIDNGSSDGTRDYLNEFANSDKGYLQNLVLKFNDTNLGIAVARNQSLKIADELDTDWYCTLDNDVIMPDGWLQECISILKVNKNYGMVGVNMEDNSYPIVTLNGCTFQNKPEGNLGTACIVFPKSTHKMLGFFNTEYGIYGEEDADFGMRARFVGYKLGYIKEMGNHFGVGKLDEGEYREFKTESHKNNLDKFRENCRKYARREKSLYIPYKD